MIPPVLSDPLPGAARAFGRFELRRLLGRSARTMVWLALDRRVGTERMLTLPRTPSSDPDALARWLERAHQAARLDHPNLARVVEVGVHEHWPFIAVERALGATLPEWIAARPPAPPTEVAGWLCDVVNGLAFAHDAGVAHGDPQLQHVLVDERGIASLMGLGAVDSGPAAAPRRASVGRGLAVDTALLQTQRAAAERDVLACGVLLHRLLAGEPPLGLADTGAVVESIAPLGREVLRLAWTTPVPIPEALRAIANRATSTQERLRYRSGRTLLGALGGWLTSHVEESGGPVAVLLDRLREVGHLPAWPGLGARVARITALEKQRTAEIAGQILPDMALSFELLRLLNTAAVQGTQIPGNGPVLTLRRVVELVGIDGVRTAANSLRPWPGALAGDASARLKATMERVRLAGHVAQSLRPAGYDAEAVFLIAVMQNLGRLMVRYHFADEAEQIDALMLPATDAPADDLAVPRPLGMTEEVASLAVLGVTIEALGAAVAHHWGLGDDVKHIIRRLGTSAPVHRPDTDADLLRLVASAANEAVDVATTEPAAKVEAALDRVVARYARALRVTSRTMKEALAEGRDALRRSHAVPPPVPLAEPTAPAALAD